MRLKGRSALVWAIFLCQSVVLCSDGTQPSAVRGALTVRIGNNPGEGVRLEKAVPDKVFVGTPFQYRYLVTNLSDYPLRNLRLYELASTGSEFISAQPEVSSMSDRRLIWEWEKMEIGEVREFTINARSNSEGVVSTDAWIEFNPVLRQQTEVVRAALEVVTETVEVGVRCDRIGFKTRVKNIGTSDLHQIDVSHVFSEELTPEGESDFFVDELVPGEGREFGGFVSAAEVGQFRIESKAISAESVSDESVVQFELAEPNLVFTCRSTPEVYIGRPMNVCLQIANKSRVAADDAIAWLRVPRFLEFLSADISGAKVQDLDPSFQLISWPLGRLGPRASREICATFSGDRAALVDVLVGGEAYCASVVQGQSKTEIKGIPALSTEFSDVIDPTPVGSQGVYLIRIRNQGSADDRNLRLSCELDEKQEFVRIDGPTGAMLEGTKLVISPLERIGPGEVVEWRIVLKALREGDARLTFSLMTERMDRPVVETESTTLY